MAEGKNVYHTGLTEGLNWKHQTWRTILHASERRYVLRLEVMEDHLFGDHQQGVVEIELEPLLADFGEKKENSEKYKSKSYPFGDNGKLSLSITWETKEEVFGSFWKVLANKYSSEGMLTKENLSNMFEFIGYPLPDQIDKQLISGVISSSNFCRWALSSTDLIVSQDDHPLASHHGIPPGYGIWLSMLLYPKLDTVVVHDIVDGKGNILWHGNLPRSSIEEDIYVQERKTGHIIIEKIPSHIKTALRMGYTKDIFRSMLASESGQKLLVTASESKGQSANSPESVKDIPEFIKFHNLDLSVVKDPIDSFKTFNDFFYRKYDLTKRPIDPNPMSAVSPADCRLSVFSSIDSAKELWIKGKGFSLSTLLENPEWEAMFEGCSLVIARLAPQDYHRYHFPVNGTLGDFVHQGHTLYTVNPVAVCF
eukprot:TRINITY_DN2328_c0_g1_i2.p1 TRINITY_DN2328_c0_g1~~TRINITY_DN2328_c0_g1_i2.p1  ORF type:complete len:462 (-),score=82.59 TRINITY_DN2328_c0_g1_i2:544-1812(-)